MVIPPDNYHLAVLRVTNFSYRPVTIKGLYLKTGIFKTSHYMLLSNFSNADSTRLPATIGYDETIEQTYELPAFDQALLGIILDRKGVNKFIPLALYLKTVKFFTHTPTKKFSVNLHSDLRHYIVLKSKSLLYS